MHFLMLFPCNSHTYLYLLFCIKELLLFLSILQVFFPPPKCVFLVHKIYLTVYFLPILLSPYVFHQFQPHCYFLNFLLPFLHLIVSSSTSNSLISLFPTLFNSLVLLCLVVYQNILSIFLLSL